MLFSIVIPVYNCKEEYLCRCMDCVDHATEDIEIIVINDGSNSATAALLNRYAASNRRINVIDQTNQGVSAARNTGIERAEGKWIVFCDADDTIDLPQLLEAAKAMEQSNAQLGSAGFRKITAGNDIVVSMESMKSAGEYAKKMLCEPGRYGTVWSKLFCRDVLISQNIRFRKELSHAEDSVFVLDYLTVIESVKMINNVFYTYYVYENSAAKKNENAVSSYMKSLNEIRKMISAAHPELIDEAGNFCDMNLLIIMVNYVFVKNRKMSDGVRMMKDICADAAAVSSLNRYNKEMMPLKNRVTLWLMKNRCYRMCCLLSALRRISR